MGVGVMAPGVPPACPRRTPSDAESDAAGLCGTRAAVCPAQSSPSSYGLNSSIEITNKP